jgi:hypothetical protein
MSSLKDEAELVPRIVNLIGRMRREEDVATQDLQWVLDQFELSSGLSSAVAGRLKPDDPQRGWEIKQEVECCLQRRADLSAISQMEDWEKVRMNFIIMKFMELTVPIRGLIRECFGQGGRVGGGAIEVLSDYASQVYENEHRRFISQIAPWLHDFAYSNAIVQDIICQQVYMVFRSRLRTEIYTEDNCPNGFLSEPFIDQIPLASPEQK